MTKKNQQIALAAGVFALILGFYVYENISPGTFSGLRGKHAAKIHDFKIDLQRFAYAETLRSIRVDSTEFIAEIENVIRQKGLPADVFVDKNAGKSSAERITGPNIAITLHDQFYKYYDTEKPNKSLEKLWEKSPEGPWDIDKQTLDSVKATLAELEPARLAIRSILKQPDTYFYYIFVYPQDLKSRFDVEITVNTEASRYLTDYTLLEEYVIAQALLDGNIAEAVGALAYMFRIAQLASYLGNVAVRSDAALVRLRAFDVMQRIVLDPKFNKSHMVYLRNMLQEQYKDWTSERVAWFGDRASGIKLYHQVLMYGESALEQSALDELKARGVDIDEVFLPGFMKYHEADEVLYLQSMQKILDISDKPFRQRQDVLNQISDELHQKDNTSVDGISTEAFLANMLLKDAGGLMRLFAKDRTALTRALALTSLSVGQSQTDNYRDFLTDEPYPVQKGDGFISITIGTLPRPFRVPDFTAAQ